MTNKLKYHLQHVLSVIRDCLAQLGSAYCVHDAVEDIRPEPKPSISRREIR
ncbi:hypothetical protein GGE59_005217 [Rhizobium leguminosarum]|nr:hypothetical protein [Rhizobium leguminosarum]MBB5682360.1 hypothetical protein [Rhizobium leguminosarum]